MDEYRVGHGYDVHRLVPARALVLGGVTIPYEKGLLGHSDADVLLHAICEALLGAAALGDIGKHFPGADERYKNISSRELLRRVVALVKETGYRIINIDATLVAQSPKLAPYIAQMTEHIAADLEIPVSRVSAKARTNEGLGEIGRGEAIAVYAVAALASSK
jgi:2-C-methyl-D-erythritol 2,4-cyclodiphosphate synthase